MAGNLHRRPETAVFNTAGEQKGLVKDETGDDPSMVPDSPGSDLELATLRLRERWELASVLNFLNVFEPIIGSDLKISAEEIEMGLINPNSSLVKLHITLLKGIPPVSKNLKDSDSWVPVLCKKLAMWWPWVADGEIPLYAAKGEETSRYKVLDPTTRLLMLKALCEIRADQDDTASYINDALKSGTQIPCFRKDKIGGDGNGTTYWYDGNTITGYRLYKEVKKIESKPKLKGKDCLTLPAVSFQWETLATNLGEFKKVVDKFSSSKVWGELAVGKTIEVDVIPILEKIQKKKEMELKRKQRQEMLLNGFQNSYVEGITRSCRIRRPVSYTYDEYDRAIDEAIQVTKKRKTDKEQKHEGKLNESEDKNEKASNESLDSDTQSGECSVKKHASLENETNNTKLQGGNGGDESDEDYLEKEDDNDDESESSHSDKENNNFGKGNLYPQKQKGCNAHNHVGSRWSTRLAGNNGNPVEEARNIVSKNRSRQRPTRNTAIESVVPDSEDEDSENTVSDISGDEESLSPDTDKEEHSDS